MFNYMGCSNSQKAYDKLHYWDFVQSLDKGFETYGSLTENQYEALTKIIETKVGEICIPYQLQSKPRYSSNNKGSPSRKATKHNFNKLEVINTVDLPFDEEDIITCIAHYFNKHSVVLEHNHRFYKIPKPTILDLDSGTVSIRFRYHRTEYKGFLCDIILGEG